MAINPDGNLYVTDGYGNARVHRYSAEGRLIQSWGQPGIGPGQFHLPHGLWAHADGRIFVADRENDRIQIFTSDGVCIDEWLDVQRPSDIYIDHLGLVYAAEGPVRKGSLSFRLGRSVAEQPAHVSILDQQGNRLLRWGSIHAEEPGNFVAPHGIWVDDEGAVYVAEVTETAGVKLGRVPRGTHTVQKFARV